MRCRWGLGGLALLLAVAGCGSRTTSSTGTPPPVTNPSSSARSPLAPFLLAAGEESGFPPNAKATNYTSAANWAAFSETPGGARRLTSEGFVDAVIESIGAGNQNGSGSSYVTEFATAGGARSEAAAQLKDAVAEEPTGSTHGFTVAGVPGAHGIVAGRATPVGTTVFWVEGRCMMGLGNSAAASLQSGVAAAVRAIYRRTHGRCP